MKSFFKSQRSSSSSSSSSSFSLSSGANVVGSGSTTARKNKTMISSRTSTMALSSLVLATLAISSLLQGCNARRLAILRRKPLATTVSIHGFPFVNDKATTTTTSTNTVLESSIFLYRGGSTNSDHEDDDEIIAGEIIDNNSDNIEPPLDNVVDNEADYDDIDQKIHTEDAIQVTSTLSNSHSPSNNHDSNKDTVEHSTHSTQVRKKSNAVGDPDGNSSDDEESEEDELDEDELEELDELEKELLLLELERQQKLKGGNQQSGGSKEGTEEGLGNNDLEKLVELAERREGMKRRIAEMEGELSRRRRNEGGTAGGEGGEAKIDLDIEMMAENVDEDEVDEEGVDEDDVDGDAEEEGEEDSTTSYHLAGTNVTKEDAILKRQRKYKRGSIFKQGNTSTTKKRRPSTTKQGNNASTTTSNNSAPTTTPTTTISQTQFDQILIQSFQSLLYLPPPSPRLPSPSGSASLRNVDVASRRRLDRRTLYHGLLAELGGSHHHHHKDTSSASASTSASSTSASSISSLGGSSSKKDNSIDSMIRRRYLDPETSRSLKGALSLACQPRWREKLSVSSSNAAAASSVSNDDGGASNNKDGSNEEGGGEDGGAGGEGMMPNWYHRGGVCLFPPDDEEDSLLYDGGGSSSRGFLRRQQSFMGGMGQQGMGNMGGMGSNMGNGMGQQGMNNMGNGMGGTPQGFFGPELSPNEDDSSSPNSSSEAKEWKCTMSMQETIAMALAHSLSCGLALIDDEALNGVREGVERSLSGLIKEWEEAGQKKDVDGEKGEVGGGDGGENNESGGENVAPAINPEELRNSALLGHLVRLANEGKLVVCNLSTGAAKETEKVEDADDDNDDNVDKSSKYGRISDRMSRDMELGLDDPNDELAVESLRLMKEDEKHWFEPLEPSESEMNKDEVKEDAATQQAYPPQQQSQPPLSLVLFLRSDSSPSILKSKSAVETLAQECVKKDGIHLLMLGGRGIDASTTFLPGSGGFGGGVGGLGSGGLGGGGVGMASGRMNRHHQRQHPQNQQQHMFEQQNGGAGFSQGTNNSPFSFMSPFPPGSPEFNAQMAQHQRQVQQQFNHNPNSQSGAAGGAGGAAGGMQGANNASGQNDPPGSRRFNIFLARTVDFTGRPQIMGTIASPQAGNLFPQILANMARENLRKLQEEGGLDGEGVGEDDEESEEREMFVRQMEELVRSAEAAAAQQQQQQQGGGAGDGSTGEEDGFANTNAAFFNATITSPVGSEIFNRMQDGDGGDGSGGPPENIRRAIQDAMSGVIDRLARMSFAASNANSDQQTQQTQQQPSQQQGEGGSSATGIPPGIPLHIARAFSQVLTNENLRRGIAENLSRAAPALMNPQCQGVMLSVYVPPGPDHPNRGMMPGDQYKQQQQRGGQGQQGRMPQQQRQEPQQGEKIGGGDVPHGMGGWLNKILSSSDKGKQAPEEEESNAAVESDESSASLDADAAKVDETPEKAAEKDLSVEPKPSKRSSSSTKGKKSKREKNLDRARTLAVAAAALAGAKKNRKDSSKHGSGASSSTGGRGPQTNVKLTPEQKARRNLLRLQALCRHVPITSPLDPVRGRSWEAWAAREQGSVIFRANRASLISHLKGRNLGLDSKSGTKGAGLVLRQMMSVREVGEEEMEDVVRCAVEIEAGKSQRHHESPWGVAKSTMASVVTVKPSLATDKSLVNFLDDISDTTSEGDTEVTTQFIHPNSLETALSLVCGVSPSPGSPGTSSTSTGAAMASHRTKEDLMALATDKHERALVPNCVSPGDIGVTYDMIGGLGEVKELLRQSITYPLKFPHLYSEGIAREAVKGVLLFGPPGTGKTMLAKAVATEGGASFLSVDASSVENKWLGESEKNAKAVFTLARRLAPCVIFIDEVDSLLSSREGSSDDSAHGTLTSVKTTMMSEWDGLNSGTNGKGDAGSDRVVVIGSTNRPFDLDEAVLRRFPRRILVDLPDLETRREILEVTLAENRLGADVNLTAIAERLEGYTGSDLKEVCREAVVQISHEQARMLDRGELLDEDDEEYLETAGSGFQMLRPVTMRDFESAMRKLKRSVSETGRELAKVWDWNDEYGEIKKTSKRDVLPQMMNMFL